MKNNVGKKTPVWRNIRTGQVVCGVTVNEALGISPFSIVGSEWIKAKTLPKQDRVVIQCGTCLQRNCVVRSIAAQAQEVGTLSIAAYGRVYSFWVVYQDDVRVIIDRWVSTTSK